MGALFGREAELLDEAFDAAGHRFVSRSVFFFQRETSADPGIVAEAPG